MEKENKRNICFLLGCTRCNTKWDVVIKNTNPRLKHFRNFLDTNCASCGSGNQAIELLGVQTNGSPQ